MNYPETLQFLFKQLPMFQRTGAAAYKANLDNTKALCRKLGNPQNNFPTIHIAGTNGKGSVSHFVASILQEAGYKTGLFTSPHLKDFRERIRINGAMIPEEKVVTFVEQNQENFKSLTPSFFEYTFSMAMQYFADEKIDILVAETGMGGRLDSTNITRSILSVITNIGFDHMQFLGNTISEIAAEKAGIIKHNAPIIIGEYQPETENIFKSKAASENTRLQFASDLFQVHKIKTKKNKLHLEVESRAEERTLIFQCPLAGQYQVKNIITAIAAISQLKELGYDISDQQVGLGINKVIVNTGIRGRWEILNETPLVICDTAHNQEGLYLVIEQLKKLTYQNLHIVLGVVADKNIDQILGLFPNDALYYFCNANIPRALPGKELMHQAKKFRMKGENYRSVKEAYSVALKTANPNDLIFIGGSTFLVAEIL